jgi:hypothetical protein
MTDIGIMVRSANPVPDSQQLTHDELSAVLLLAQQRSGEMDVSEVVRPIEPDQKPKWRGWLVAVAAFAVVVGIVGIALLFSSRTPSEAPATNPPVQVTTTIASAPTTVESVPSTTQAPTTSVPQVDSEALAFVESLVTNINTGDHGSAGAQIDPVDEINKNGYVPGVTDDDWTPFFRGMFEYWTLVDSQLSIEGCQTSETSGVTRCSLTRRSSEAFPTAPEELILLVRLDNGVLKYFEQGPDVLSQFWQDYLVFDEWLYETTFSQDTSIYNAWFSYASPTGRVAIDREFGSAWVDAGRPAWEDVDRP